MVEKRKVTFKVRAPAAKEVALAGDFNQWDDRGYPMEMDDEGHWKVTVFLSPGKYEYKLLVDGRWWEDMGNKKTVPNRFGTFNRVIVVPER